LDVAPWKTDRTLCVPIIGLQNYERMSRVVYAPEASMQAQPVPGVGDALRNLAPHYRLYIVTARSQAQMAWSKKWLRQQDLLSLFSGFLSSGERLPDGSKVSKAVLCKQNDIGILVDDDQRHLMGEALRDFRRILLKHGATEATAPSGIILTTSWSEVTELLLNGESQ
jgi:5'(3')-deoxyribonucleotidase